VAADQIFVLLLIGGCAVGLTILELRSRRRHKFRSALETEAASANPAAVMPIEEAEPDQRPRKPRRKR
jgi:hypothetical protein